MDIPLFVPLKASELEHRLVSMPLFLYRDAGWTQFWSTNLQRPQIVLRHHDYAFSERVEAAVISGKSDPLMGLSALRMEYGQRVEKEYSCKDISVKLDALVISGEEITFKSGEDMFHELSRLQDELERYAGQSAKKVFSQNLSLMTLHLPSEENSWRKSAALRFYGQTFVQALRQQDIPFYAFYVPTCFFAHIVAHNDPQNTGYVTSMRNVPLLQLTTRKIFQ